MSGFDAGDFQNRTNGNRPAELEAIRGDASTVHRTRWAWEGWVPLGSFLLIAGEPGAGKGILTSYLLANLTNGTSPGDLKGDPVNVLWIGFEDSWDEVVLPRLLAAGADVGRVYRLHVATVGQYLDLVRDAQALAQLVDRHKLRVITFEALVDHMPVAADDHRNADVRKALVPLVELARTRQLVAVGTTHLNKVTSGGYRHRVAGSGGYLAVARVGLLVHRHPENRELRVLALGKGNLGRVPDSLVFEIHGVEVPNPADPLEVADVGALREPYFDSSLTVDEVLAGPSPDHGSKKDMVHAFLRDYLKDGRKPAAEVVNAARDHGIGRDALSAHYREVARNYQQDRAWWYELKGDV